MSYRAIPGVVYTNPEIAGVGETEESASAKGITCQVIKLPMAYSGRFVAENEGVNGVCKVLLDERRAGGEARPPFERILEHKLCRHHSQS